MHLPNITEAYIPDPKLSGYLLDNAVSSVQQTPFGAKYLIEGRISGPAGTAAAIRSIWFIETGERRPRFVTAYPLRGTQK